MLRRAIWDKLPECIFENFETVRKKQGQSRAWFIPKIKNLSHPSQVFYKLPRAWEHLCSGQHLDGVFFRNNVESSKLKNEYSNIRGQNKKK